jgi:hypothetical protein
MKFFFSLLLLISCFFGFAQPITGVWRGKIINGSGMFASTGKVELKLNKKGDSLLGTCYYFNNANTYMRYSVKGYFDSVNNSVHWKDDKFLGVKPVGKTPVGVFRDPMISEADFNCPGNNVMKLDGKSQIGEEGPEFTLHFDKVDKPIFHDEWDNVIEGYFTGMADPGIIDSVYAIAKPYEPTIPDDVAKKVNPVIPGQQTVPGNSTMIPESTAQNPKTPGAGTTSAPGEKPVTATTAGIINENQPNKTEGSVNTTTVDGGKKAGVTGEPVAGLAKEPAVGTTTAGTSTKPALPVDSTGIIAAKNKPANDGIPGESVPPPSSGLPGSKTETVKTIADTKTPGSSTAGDGGKVGVTTAVVTKPSAGSGKNPATTNSKPPLPSAGVTGTPPAVSVAKQTVPVNTNPGLGNPSATTSTEVSIPGSSSVKTLETAVPVVKHDLPVVATATPAIIKSDPLAERMFITRKKISQAEIPVIGDSIELNFYDNAEIDGDSISLFLNGKLLFNHVLLSAQAYKFKIPASDLPEGSELTMVAENLGTIPPNTAYMMAIVNGERYSARIESTEQTSGVIKLVRKH